MHLSGTLLVGPEFEPCEGRLHVADGTIESIERTTVNSDAIVMPAFVNAHTHLGDSIAKEAGEGLSLDELVAPPDGLKHRLLGQADDETLVAAMARSIQFMERAGTAATLEFREGGRDGVALLDRALAGQALRAVTFGRGDPSVLDVADGYGASGAADRDFTAERAAAADADAPFAIHAGEVDARDIDPALDLDPDLLVHMVHATEAHLDRVERESIPVAVCPRSNLATGVGRPPIAALHDRTTVALGTDNVMLSSPSMFREMAYAADLSGVPAAEILAMATHNGAQIAGLDGGTITEGAPARLIVLDGDSDNLAGVQDVRRAVVRRASVADVTDVLLPE
ncbi:amidohydrolase family protein [Halococcoides cellulosivorans]|uniref:Nucleoside deaminase n=1 Tax=Halococcoides cellulosivorans TaxID=1679096 RepID=A0A2R4WYP3_9EURY|nr:amidohydrolase family protein [Halococcoides cellulosivorans]AWB26657.1 nucleoside deaminase [Halococcoides cellulosivorans]